jgi:hypothetical protein
MTDMFLWLAFATSGIGGLVLLVVWFQYINFGSRTKIVEKQVTSDRTEEELRLSLIEDATKNGRLGTARNNVVIETIQERNRKLHLALGAAYPNVCFIQPSKHGD